MNVAIVESNIPLLENLALLLGGEEGITVTGTFSRGEDALVALARGGIDVVLVDLGLPDMDGIELIGELKACVPEVNILVNTVFDDRPRIRAALQAGASGYVLKGATTTELLAAVQNCEKQKQAIERAPVSSQNKKKF
jgi:two-component system, NarL family, response regulator